MMAWHSMAACCVFTLMMMMAMEKDELNKLMVFFILA
jgi:hypothetical protein